VNKPRGAIKTFNLTSRGAPFEKKGGQPIRETPQKNPFKQFPEGHSSAWGRGGVGGCKPYTGGGRGLIKIRPGVGGWEGGGAGERGKSLKTRHCRAEPFNGAAKILPSMQCIFGRDVAKASGL